MCVLWTRSMSLINISRYVCVTFVYWLKIYTSSMWNSCMLCCEICQVGEIFGLPNELQRKAELNHLHPVASVISLQEVYPPWCGVTRGGLINYIYLFQLSFMVARFWTANLNRHPRIHIPVSRCWAVVCWLIEDGDVVNLFNFYVQRSYINCVKWWIVV